MLGNENLRYLRHRALAEVAKIIGENALTYLSEYTLNCTLAPPQIVLGTKQALVAATDKAVVVPLQVKIDTFKINISLRAD